MRLTKKTTSSMIFASSFIFFLTLSCPLGAANQQSAFSTEGWVIGTMCAAALLTLVALMVCFVRRNAGGKYAGTPPPPPAPSQQQDMFPLEEGQSLSDQGCCASARFASGRRHETSEIQTNKHMIVSLGFLQIVSRASALRTERNVAMGLSPDFSCLSWSWDASTHSPIPN